MRFFIPLLLFIFLFLNGSDRSVEGPLPKEGAINPIIGDVSYLSKYGERPDAEVKEGLRIRTHLKYVEEKLRSKDVSSLSQEKRAKRMELLDLLREYRKNGEFPTNYKYERRKPCFIDRDGNICAVGYLVAKTVGRGFAEKIASDFRYARIHEMESPGLKEWVASSGLTLMECAMIQPAYRGGGSVGINVPEPEYEAGTAFLAGVNLSMTTLNAVDLGRGRRDPVKSAVGLSTGLASTTLGILNYDAEGTTRYNKRIQTLSLFNIGIGTATALVSGYRLLKAPDPVRKDMSFNLFSYPMRDDRMAVGASFTKRF